MTKRLDLTGQTFGILKVIEPDYEKEKIFNEGKKKKKTFWKCQCDCGNFTTVSTENLRNLHTTSCGCLKKTGVNAAKVHKKENRYEINGDVVTGYDWKNRPFTFDLADLPVVKQYSWYVTPDGYVTTAQPQHGKKIMLHKLLTGTDKSQIVDHADRNPSNNRRSNFRFATPSQNLANGNIRSDNTTGIIGVSVYKPNPKKYSARIQWKGVSRNKTCENFEEAVKTRLLWEQELFGEFAPQKHLFEQYGISEISNNEGE